VNSCPNRPAGKVGVSLNDLRFVIVSGLSGAGKSEAIHALEDLGYFCVDNLPPSLLSRFAELFAQAAGGPTKAAAVFDIRGGEFFEYVHEALAELERQGFTYTILYLEAADDVLIRRYKETRRLHPLAGEGGVVAGIQAERVVLDGLRSRAHAIIDTSGMTPRQLREKIARIYGGQADTQRLLVNIVSFGFKHGLPLDADLVFDVRFLPNPNYIEALSPHDGTDPAVAEYVMRWPVTRQFLRRIEGFLVWLLPNYVAEGKTQLQISIGCTGGRHRSVVIAAALADALKGGEWRVVLHHRDLGEGGPSA